MSSFKKQLDAVSSVRLPLILLIVSCHVLPIVNEGTIDWWIIKLIGYEMAGIGVPLFFLISGLLFFCNAEKQLSFCEFTLQIYSRGSKIYKRVKSILIPYFLWNLLAYLTRALTRKSIDFSWQMILSHHVYWDWNWEPKGFFMYPCDGPLWFMRNLFIICLCAPMVFYFVKRIPLKMGLSTLAFVYIGDFAQGQDMGLLNTFCLFTAGAYIGLNRKDVLTTLQRGIRYILPIYLMLAIADLFLIEQNWHPYLFRLSIILGMGAFFTMACKLPNQYQGIKFPSLSMFIYCAHGFLLEPSVFIVRHLEMTNMTMVFLLNWSLTVFVCILCYLFVRNLFPITGGKLLLGGRV